MKAAAYYGRHDVGVDDVPGPRIEEPRDAIDDPPKMYHVFNKKEDGCIRPS